MTLVFRTVLSLRSMSSTRASAELVSALDAKVFNGRRLVSVTGSAPDEAAYYLVYLQEGVGHRSEGWEAGEYRDETDVGSDHYPCDGRAPETSQLLATKWRTCGKCPRTHCGSRAG
jgi:hypothetical protein